ncbi:MAG: PilZ domain-containing protein [Elusimicrobia bacterium]|nr:PilZ domain-containing protein [Elusimicrobiota bacterium]
MDPLDESGPTHFPRAAERAATDFVIEIHNPDGKTLRGISRLLDLSVSGACVDSASDLIEGDRFVIRLLLDAKSVIALPVTVVWKRYFTKTFQYGLRFGEYAEETRKIIETFVGEYSAKLRKMGPKIIFTDTGVQEV